MSENRNARRQKLKVDFEGLVHGALDEVKEFGDRAAAQAREAMDNVRSGTQETIDEIKGDPRVKRAREQTKKTLATLGARLLKTFGTQAQREAVERATRKRTRKPKSTTPPPTVES